MAWTGTRNLSFPSFYFRVGESLYTDDGCRRLICSQTNIYTAAIAKRLVDNAYRSSLGVRFR